MNPKISLDDAWRFQPDPANEGVVREWFKPEHDKTRWREVNVPISFDQCLPILERYQGHGWYSCNFDVPTDWQGKRITLRFEGVNYHATVWVNGEHVGSNRDSFLPFEFAVGQRVKAGESNSLIVCVDNLATHDDVPGMRVGWRPDGGILREVNLIATDHLRIDHVAVTASPTEAGGSLAVAVDAVNGRPTDSQLQVEVVVLHENAAPYTSEPTGCATGTQVTLNTSGEVEGVKPWTPDEPNLYELTVKLLANGEVVDQQNLRIGFRTVEAKDGRLHLNGEPIFLTGYNRHEDTHTLGMCTDLATTRADLIAMKEAGANFIRLAHYPHHPAELNFCDELGLLVMEEIPLYWWHGKLDGDDHAANTLATAKRQLTTMIRRDINHPSIIFWSVSNEIHEQHADVVKANNELIHYARSLDATRLITHVSNHWQGQWADCHPEQFVHGDVICVNAYPSVKDRIADPLCDEKNATQFWKRELSRMHNLYPDKPIFVTEFGYPSLQGVWEADYGEDVQAKVLESEFAGMYAPYVCGTAVWCWADHAWPGSGFCKQLRISPYGVLTRDRKPLAALNTIAQLFRERQVISPDLPYRRIRMIRDHLEGIPDVPVPVGFRVVMYQPGDREAWLQIHRDAYADDPVEITDDLHVREFGEDESVIAERQLFIESSEGEKVATATAWVNEDFHGERCGQVHWVAISPKMQGKGLSKPLMSALLKQFKTLGHDKAMLVTHSTRLAAIQLYLAFGFKPEL